MAKIKSVLIGLTVSVLPFIATPAKAEILYPWCAYYGGRGGGGATNCGFTYHWQCMAAISGVGGNCYENPTYQGPAPRERKRRRG